MKKRIYCYLCVGTMLFGVVGCTTKETPPKTSSFFAPAKKETKEETIVSKGLCEVLEKKDASKDASYNSFHRMDSRSMGVQSSLFCIDSDTGVVYFANKGNDGYLLNRVQTTQDHYAYLKIADGCYNHCTYCLIPKIRGKYRSYPMEKLIVEAKELGNIAELIIVAQDSTRYGEDLYGENRFVALLQELSKLDNIQSIRLLYCYPDVITDELIEEVATNDKILKYMDIPLQHSENRVLKLMNRKGKREGYLQLFEKLRARIPNIAIRSTFITGFPSETEEEFEGMLSFVREAKLLNCGFFAYSREPDTGAYKMKPQIHHNTKKRRVRALYEAQAEVAYEILSSFIGQEIDVLCDGIDYERNCFVGRAYFNAPDIDGKVYFHAAEAMQGKYYRVLIENNDAYDLFGRTDDYEGE